MTGVLLGVALVAGATGTLLLLVRNSLDVTSSTPATRDPGRRRRMLAVAAAVVAVVVAAVVVLAVAR